MLVLTRSVGEKIHINDDIEITIMKLDRNQVRLGVEAPPNVAVHRAEIYERIQAEKKKKAAEGDNDKNA